MRAPAEQARDVAQRPRAVHGDAGREPRRRLVVDGDDEPVQADARGGLRDRDGAAGAAQLARELQVAPQAPRAQRVGADLVGGGEDRVGDRQAVAAADAPDVRRRDVHDDAAARHLIAAVGDRGGHALACLALDAVAEADDRETTASSG